jgi:uncharacterized protein (TIGR03545 family)
MSTAGSVHSGTAPAYTPGTEGTGNGEQRKRNSLFRWRGIIPLALLLAMVVVGWMLFGDVVASATLSEAGSKALGAQLDIGSARIRTFAPSIELRDVALADPFDRTRNLVEAGSLLLELEPRPLLEKKVVVRRLRVSNVRTDTRRATPARVVPGGGFALRARTEVQRFVSQFSVPMLSLKNLGALKEIALDPSKLRAVQAATALARQADSTRAGLARAYGNLRLQETLDSSGALLTRLQGSNLRTFGVEGARRAVADVRVAMARVDSARGRVDGLLALTRRGIDSLQTGVAGIEQARRDDYRSARDLLQLPTFEGPDMGAALFGKVTIDRFQQAMYWATLARGYMPPGLLPRESDGPERARMAGSTIHFASAESFPRFLLRRANMDITVTEGRHAGRYAFAASNVTSDPAVVGQPMVFALRRAAREGEMDSLRASGSLDHTGDRRREVFNVQTAGIALPILPIPSLPYRLDPGLGSSEMRFVLDGDRITGRWAVRSNKLAWHSDSARARSLNATEMLVARVLTGIGELDLVADIGGTLHAPTLAVRSNLGRQISERLKTVLGEEIAAAERRVRAQVDRFVDEKSAPAKERVAEVRAEGERRVSEARTRLEAERRKLEERLRGLSGGLLNVPRLPGG